MSIPETVKQVILHERPTAAIEPTTFKTVQVAASDLISKLQQDQVIVRVDYVSLDPAMRGWLGTARSYIPPVQIGEVMRAAGIGQVVKIGPAVTRVKVGDFVQANPGWAEYAVLDESGLTPLSVPKGGEFLDYLGVLGATGLTAYFGLTDIGQLKAGETLVVSGAAGATGSVVCQLGKIIGAKVIAIAGTDDKCKWLEDELGVDKALNYKDHNFVNDFKQSVGYLDVYFDNVGGEILDLCLTRLKKYARIVLCGAISAYSEFQSSKVLLLNPYQYEIERYTSLITQSAKMQGFIVFNYAEQYGHARKTLGEWLAEGKLKRRFHIEEGLEKCPEYLTHLYEGKNTGKMVVRVSSGPVPKL